MRKRNKGRKFGRKKDQRKALLKSLAHNLFLREKIKTTEAKAKEAKILVEKLITKAKKGDLSSTRLLAGYLSPVVVKKLINEIAPKYKERKGGYTRIIRLGQRQADSAQMVIFELVEQ
ncbi:50S ribosomal protein L17 [Patescibacteria group bacterium]|nr:50S ribosomal protein L17 [Patescibacteria group bacterium]MBU4274908.1 50S ribosomal protein L17 [Patescibacteria group bacterium]MBU4367910.1 50S ribosomal protein L17 [Patescibacteria group bacterium]MBU4461913.1 50S ribosomal protein L17 [Patescibacteria group bacterium]MCG2699856.1 50S ribosomal protein L17 [Candidatus Parcubacteria bacterium]